MSDGIRNTQENPTARPAGTQAPASDEGAASYTSPRCERLGRWSVLTLQQTIVIPP
jgi:hypothetical protein